MTTGNRRTAFRQAAIYTAYIVLACLFTAELNFIHSRFMLDIELTPESFIMPVAAGILFGYLIARNELLSEQMAQMAYTDPLTHIYNRLHFNSYLEKEIDKVKRYGGTFSIIYFDIDNFKQINDSHGHVTGDSVLIEFSRTVSALNRNSDTFARYGGEEFIILAASTDMDGACEHAQRLRGAIEKHPFSIGKVTCSFGVAGFDVQTDDACSIIERADAALYEAKTGGRNRVVRK